MKRHSSLDDVRLNQNEAKAIGLVTVSRSTMATMTFLKSIAQKQVYAESTQSQRGTEDFVFIRDKE